MLKAQQDRDDRVRKLWGIVPDALDFMKQAEPLKKIEGLGNTVQSLMNQIYECALFLRGYGDRGFFGESAVCSSISNVNLLAILGRVARDTFTVSMDDATQQFTDAFTELGHAIRRNGPLAQVNNRETDASDH